MGIEDKENVENPNVRYYSEEDISRLKKLVQEGSQVLQEIEDLRESLSDTVKSVAEEVGVKPSQLQKVIKIAHKANLHEERAKFEEIEDILRTIDKTL